MGLQRNHSYWAFKIWKESYLHHNSTWGWPRLELIWLFADERATDALAQEAAGYAIVECADKTMRVLELICPEGLAIYAWQKIAQTAIDRGIERIRGWEGSALEPFRQKNLVVRDDWSIPMILPFAKSFPDLDELDYCPLLELDHF